MKPHGLSGKLVAIDGTDGSGKTTTLAFVSEWLRARGIAAEMVKTPSVECRALTPFRRYIETPSRAVTGEIDLTALSLVCLGDRLQTVRTQVLPLLAAGTWVLCDRYVYSTLAELAAIGASPQSRAAIREVVNLFPKPDLAILTTIAPDKAIRRVHARADECDMVIDGEIFARFVESFLSVAREEELVVLATEGGEMQARATLQPMLESLLPARASAIPPRPRRTIVFDLFGTIAPPFSRAGYERMLSSIAESLGVSLRPFRALWFENAPHLIAGRMASSEASLRRIADRMHVELTERGLQAALEIISGFIRGSLMAAPAHLEVLDGLRRDGFRIGLLSNCAPEVPRIWPETPLASRFDAACFSCAIGATKPAPEAYLEVCRRLGVEPTECLYIGDGSDEELTAARGLGMHAVLLRSSTADTFDPSRRDAEEWDGDAIATLADIGEDLLYGRTAPGTGARS